MSSDPQHPFDLEMHLIRDRGSQALKAEIERLHLSKIAYCDYVDKRTAELMAGGANWQANLTFLSELPKLPQVLEEDVLRIASSFGVPRSRHVSVIPKPPRRRHWLPGLRHAQQQGEP